MPASSLPPMLFVHVVGVDICCVNRELNAALCTAVFRMIEKGTKLMLKPSHTKIWLLSLAPIACPVMCPEPLSTSLLPVTRVGVFNLFALNGELL